MNSTTRLPSNSPFELWRYIAVQPIGLAQGGSFISANSEGLTLISLVEEFTERKRGANVIGDETNDQHPAHRRKSSASVTLSFGTIHGEAGVAKLAAENRYVLDVWAGS